MDSWSRLVRGSSHWVAGRPGAFTALLLAFGSSACTPETRPLEVRVRTVDGAGNPVPKVAFLVSDYRRDEFPLGSNAFFAGHGWTDDSGVATIEVPSQRTRIDVETYVCDGFEFGGKSFYQFKNGLLVRDHASAAEVQVTVASPDCTARRKKSLLAFFLEASRKPGCGRTCHGDELGDPQGGGSVNGQ